MNPAAVLEVKALRVTRGSTAILRRINWRVGPGEHWVILGANGSGKTSLLKALTGFLSPTSGEISLLGKTYGEADWRELRLQIGVVTSAFGASIPLAEFALDTVVSGKYAQLDLWQAGTRADRLAAKKLLRLVGLARIAEREWAYLSQGERQRVLIARALMARPRLLILDEPCAGLDPVAREKFVRFVEQLARHETVGGALRPDSVTRRAKKTSGHKAPPTAGPALVLVTHHVEEITPAFTHALLVRGGRVVAAGPRREVLTSKNVSTTFAAPLRLAHRSGRLSLK